MDTPILEFYSIDSGKLYVFKLDDGSYELRNGSTVVGTCVEFPDMLAMFMTHVHRITHAVQRQESGEAVR